MRSPFVIYLPAIVLAVDLGCTTRTHAVAARSLADDTTVPIWITVAAASATAVSRADLEYQLPDVTTLLANAHAPSRDGVIQVGQGPFAAREVPDGRLVLVPSNGRFIIFRPV